MQLYALRPSSEWYGLCAGLLTRAVLEGYVCGGWKGLGALETLMKVGLGLRPDVLNIPTEDSPNLSVSGNGESSAPNHTIIIITTTTPSRQPVRRVRPR
jgi:hypothetical protein